jgi:hypothetical protein
MSEQDLPIRSGASPRKPTTPTIKLEQKEIQLPLRTIKEASPTMDVKQQPVEAQFLPDAIEIFKLEGGGVSHRSTLLDSHGWILTTW